MPTRSLGTTLKITDTTPVTIGGLTEIGGLELSADTIDVTTLDSDGGYRDFIAGFKDAGEVALSGYFNADAGQEALYDAFESGESKAFEILFPVKIGKKWTFNGIVTGYKTGVSLEDPVSFECTIKVIGAPTLADATV